GGGVEKAVQGGAVALAELTGRDAARAVVLRERAPRTQMQDAHVAFRRAEPLGGLAAGCADHVAQQEHRAWARSERFEGDEERVGEALGEAVARFGIRALARCAIEPILLRRLARGRQPRPGVAACST